MRGLDRSRFLQGVAGAGGSSLAGCLDVNSRADRSVRFCELELLNTDSTEHRVRIQLLGSGETAYEATANLEAREQGNSSPRVDIDSLSFDANDLSSDEGRFELRVWVDSGPWTEHELSPEDATPVAALVTIQDDGSVAFFRSINPDCDGIGDDESTQR